MSRLPQQACSDDTFGDYNNIVDVDGDNGVHASTNSKGCHDISLQAIHLQDDTSTFENGECHR